MLSLWEWVRSKGCVSQIELPVTSARGDGQGEENSLEKGEDEETHKVMKGFYQRVMMWTGTVLITETKPSHSTPCI